MSHLAAAQIGIGRERSPCSYNLEPLSVDDEESSLRAEDFLNDKLQSQADFGSFEELIAAVEAQQIQLQTQLQAAQTKLDNAQKESTEHLKLLVQQTEEFNSQQASIDNRLAIVTSSDAPDDAVASFRAPMESLRKLELGHLYIELLQEVEDLTEEARASLPQNPKQALIPYTRLRDMSQVLVSLQKPTDGAASHLVDFVNTRAIALWTEMQYIMAEQMKSILKEMNYPTEQIDTNAEFVDCFNKMLDLQEPEYLSASESIILLPFNVMTEDFRNRFRFHFMGDRETNTKGNPDAAFEWVLRLFPERQDNLRQHVTPLLAARFKDTQFANNSLYMDALFALITAFLPVIREKSEQYLSRTTNEPQYMSKYIQELIRFDVTLREEFKYDGGNIKSGWGGITLEVLGKWFDPWMAAEKQFALARYQSIVASLDSGSIDYDSSVVGKTKATFGASKVMDLLNSVTRLYQPLRSFSYKLRFLIDVQLWILDQYHTRLNDSIDAYTTMSSTVGRTLHGISKEDQARLEGIGGLESLCKVYGSADHVIRELHDQSNNVFFVDLWAELQRRARKHDGGDALAGSMSYADIKSSTSSAVGSQDEGAVFDETSEAYQRLRSQAERLMIDDVKYSLPRLFKNYFQKPQWLTIDVNAEGDEATIDHITAELDEPLRALRARLQILHKSVSTATLRRVWRSVSSDLQDLLWRQIVVHSRFTVTGGRQFSRDVKSITDMFDGYIPRASESSIGMLKIQEAARLLSLPLAAREGSIGIHDAYNRVMEDNQSAKSLVDEFEFKELDYQECRRVLEHRVEVTE